MGRLKATRDLPKALLKVKQKKEKSKYVYLHCVVFVMSYRLNYATINAAYMQNSFYKQCLVKLLEYKCLPPFDARNFSIVITNHNIHGSGL
jgi:hypothetical protein